MKKVLAGVLVTAGVLSLTAWLLLDAVTVTEDELQVDSDGVTFVDAMPPLDFLVAHCKPDQPPPVTQREQLALHGYRRTFSYYKPARMAARPAVLVVLHGSGGSGEQVHELLGQDFVRLADLHGFPVIYVDGFGGGWNDLRTRSPHLAKKLDLDEIAYFREVLTWAGRQFEADLDQAYYFGMSNGAQMILKLLVQAPELVTAAALVGGNLPQAPGSELLYARLRPRPVMFVNGTADDVVPYEGGEVRLFGIFDFGSVHSSEETVLRWVGAAGLTLPPATMHLDRHDDGTSIDLFRWSEAGRPEVRAYRVNGGKHTIPMPPGEGRCRTLSDSGDMNTVDEAWAFFSADARARGRSR